MSAALFTVVLMAYCRLGSSQDSQPALPSRGPRSASAAPGRGSPAGSVLRFAGGQIYNLSDPRLNAVWPTLSGKCDTVTSDGVVLQTFTTNNVYQSVFVPGNGGPAGAYGSTSGRYEKRLVSSSLVPDKRVFLVHYSPVAEGQSVSARAILLGTRAVDGHVLESWDCGAAPTPEQLADRARLEESKRQELEAQKSAVRAASDQALEDKRQALKANVVKINQQRADKGDADAQFRMGELYRDGDGVPKDDVRAREFFGKAASQGNKDAARALEKMNASK